MVTPDEPAAGQPEPLTALGAGVTFRLAVVNQGGRDPDQAFPDGAGSPDAPGHPPVNYHAYAAATGGWFCRSADAVPAEAGGALVLMRRRIGPAADAVAALKARGIPVAVSWKEAGALQVAEQLADPGRLRVFRSLCAAADGALASTPELVPLYRGAGARVCRFLPTPYPVDDPRWNFSVEETGRSGVLIGTRDFRTPSRNHLAALVAASAWGCPVTLVNLDGKPGRKWAEAAGLREVRFIERRLPYPEYLRLVAGHRIVFQLDRSGVPGQVAGDAALCGVPCVGGDGATDRLLLPEMPDPERLLADPEHYRETVRALRARALERLAFGAAAAALERFFGELRGETLQGAGGGE